MGSPMTVISFLEYRESFVRMLCEGFFLFLKIVLRFVWIQLSFKFGFIELFVVGVLTLFGQGSKGDAVPLG